MLGMRPPFSGSRATGRRQETQAVTGMSVESPEVPQPLQCGLGNRARVSELLPRQLKNTEPAVPHRSLLGWVAGPAGGPAWPGPKLRLGLWLPGVRVAQYHVGTEVRQGFGVRIPLPGWKRVVTGWKHPPMIRLPQGSQQAQSTEPLWDRGPA